MNICFVEIPVCQGRCALQYFVIIYIATDSGLGLNLDPVTDANVSRTTNLPANQTVLTNFGRTRNPGLSGYGCIFSNFNIVSDLDLVVQFDSFSDSGGSQGGTINGGARSYFHIIPHNNISGLRYFLVHPFGIR